MNSKKRTKGFTLVELLFVVAIVGLLTTVAVASVSGALASQRLSTAMRQLSADLHQATMLARKENLPVELRFYQLPPATQPGAMAWRAYQIGLLNGWDAEGNPRVNFPTEMQRFPEDVVLMPDAQYNSFQGQPVHQNASTGPAADAPYVSYFIHSNGATTLPLHAPAVLTLVRETTKGIPATLPKDFRSIVIDPQTHQSRTY
ncbi:Verru_Chthon cassette protein D [Phragmitibacter flavus]|nr:Verru_Chthon cassette protein D [Phragmitibacter flavus]